MDEHEQIENMHYQLQLAGEAGLELVANNEEVRYQTQYTKLKSEKSKNKTHNHSLY